MGQSGQYLLALGCVPAMTLDPREQIVGSYIGWRGIPLLAVDGVLARTQGPQGGWIVRSHIDWRDIFIRVLLAVGSVSAMMLTPKRWIVRFHIGWRDIPYKSSTSSGQCNNEDAGPKGGEL